MSSVDISNSDDEQGTSTNDVQPLELSGKGQKKKKYSLKRKVEVIDYARTHDKNKAAKKFDIHRRRVQEWCKNEPQIREECCKTNSVKEKSRLAGGGRKETSQELNDCVFEWIKQQREKRHCVSRRLIQIKAQQIGSEFEKEGKLENGTFIASKGWLDKFLERHNLSIRRTTTVCQKPPSDYIPKLVKFVMFIRNQRKIHHYPYGHVYACDETAVWIDPAGAYCVSERGAREVSVQSTGHDKLHITVMLCAHENGSKCLPFVLLPRKRPIPDILKKFSGKLVLSWAGKVWFDDELTLDFLKRVIGRFSFTHRLLVWDAFRCHISERVKAELKRLNVDAAVIPGGCTKYVQAPDVCWNKPFKLKISEKYEDWLLSGEKSYTAAGNMRAPPMEIYLQWVVESWDSLSADLIKKSFMVCGVSNALDGTEDDLIHCFKADGPCPDGRELLREEATKFNSEQLEVEILEEEEDREQNEENGYASDCSLEM